MHAQKQMPATRGDICDAHTMLNEDNTELDGVWDSQEMEMLLSI